MGIYYARTPNGGVKAYRIAGDSPDDVESRRIRYDLSKIAPIAAPASGGEEDAPGVVEAGFQGGLAALDTGIARAMYGLGWDETAGRYEQSATDRAGYVARRTPVGPQSIEDVGGIGDALGYAYEMVGSGLGSTVPTILGAGAGAVGGALTAGPFGVLPGSIVGAGGVALGQQTGEMLQAQQAVDGRSLKDTDLGRAAAYAVPAAALDTFSTYLTFGVSKALGVKPGNFIRALVGASPKKAAASLVGEEVAKSIPRRMLAAAGSGFATEGLTEGAQQALQEMQADPDKFWEFGPQIRSNLLNSFVGGGLAGGVIGGTVGAFPDRASAGERRVPNDKAREQLIADEQARSIDDAEIGKRYVDETKKPTPQPLLGLPAPPKPAPTLALPDYSVAERPQEDPIVLAQREAAVEGADLLGPYRPVAVVRDGAVQGFEINDPKSDGTIYKTAKEAAKAAYESNRREQRDELRKLWENKPIPKEAIPDSIGYNPDVFDGATLKELREGVGFAESEAVLDKIATLWSGIDPETKAPAPEPRQAAKVEYVAAARPVNAKPVSGERPAGSRPDIETYDKAAASKRAPVWTVMERKLDEEGGLIEERPVSIHDTEQSAKNAAAVASGTASEFDPEAAVAANRAADKAAAEEAFNNSRPYEGVVPDATQTTDQVAPTSRKPGILIENDAIGLPFVSRETTQAVPAANKRNAAVVAEQLRGRLKAIGLGFVNLRILRWLEGQSSRTIIEGEAVGRRTGRQEDELIKLATGVFEPGLSDAELARRMIGVLNHEAVHTMRNLGVFGKREWAALEKYVMTTKVPGKLYTFFDVAELRYAGQSQEFQAEEAVAEAFRAWAETRKAPAHITSLFGRIVKFFRSLGETMNSKEAKAIFAKMDEGKLSQLGGDMTGRKPEPRPVASGNDEAVEPVVAQDAEERRLSKRGEDESNVLSMSVDDPDKNAPYIISKTKRPGFGPLSQSAVDMLREGPLGSNIVDLFNIGTINFVDKPMAYPDLADHPRLITASGYALTKTGDVDPKGTIYVSATDPMTGKPFDYNKMIEVVMHETFHAGARSLLGNNKFDLLVSYVAIETANLIDLHFDLTDPATGEYDKAAVAQAFDNKSDFEEFKRWIGSATHVAVNYKKESIPEETAAFVVGRANNSPGKLKRAIKELEDHVGDWASEFYSAGKGAYYLSENPPAARLSEKELTQITIKALKTGWEGQRRLSARTINGDVITFTPRYDPDVYNKAAPDRRMSATTLGQRVPISPNANSRLGEVVYGEVADMFGKIFGKVGISQEAVDTAFIKMQDKALPIGRMVDFIRKHGGIATVMNDAKMREELFAGRTGERIRINEENLYQPFMNSIKALGFTTAQLQSLKNVSPDVAKIASDERSINKGMINAFLYARHAQERNAVVRFRDPENNSGSGISDEAAQSALKWFAAQPNYARLLTAETKARAIIKNTNETYAQYGLVPPDIADVSKDPSFAAAGLPDGFKYYVPLRGFREEDIEHDAEMEDAFGSGVGFKIRGQENRTFTGRSRIAAPVIISMIMQNEVAVIRGEKNLVGNAVLKLVQENEGLLKDAAKVLPRAPMTKTISSAGVLKYVPEFNYKGREDVFVTKVDGKEVAIEFADSRISRALSGSTGLGDKTANSLVRAIGTVTRVMASLNTAWNPEFTISNMLRDIQTAGINIQQFEQAGLAAAVLKNIPVAMKAVHSMTKETIGAKKTAAEAGEFGLAYERMALLGGKTDFWGIKGLRERVVEANRELVLDEERTTLEKGWRKVQAIGNFIEAYNETVETATRVAVFKALVDKGMNEERAAQAAKNVVTNFNKGGEWKGNMNAFYMFYNAAVQGSFSIISAAIKSPKVRRIIAGVVAAGFVQDMLMSMIGGEDDNGNNNYDNIPDYVLETRMVFMDPFGFTERGYFAIPMPYGYNAFHNMGRTISRAMRGRYSAGEVINTGLGTFLDAFNPVGGTNNLLNFVAPTVLDPIADLYSNQDFAGRPIYKEGSAYAAGLPRSQMYFNSVSSTSQFVTDQLNKLTGGSEVRPGVVDVSPDILDYIFEYFAGGAGRLASNVGGIGLAAGETVTGINPDAIVERLDTVREIPVIRKFYGNVTSENDMERYIGLRDEVGYARKELEASIKNGDITGANEIRKKYKNELAAYPAIDALDNMRDKLLRQIKQIEASRTIPEDAKRERVKALRERIKVLVNRAIATYNERVRDR